MKSFLNSWIIRYLVIFILATVLLFGYKMYFDRYEYTLYSTDTSHNLIKIDKKTGDVYRFSTNSTSGRVWELLNK